MKEKKLTNDTNDFKKDFALFGIKNIELNTYTNADDYVKTFKQRYAPIEEKDIKISSEIVYLDRRKLMPNWATVINTK